MILNTCLKLNYDWGPQEIRELSGELVIMPVRELQYHLDIPLDTAGGSLTPREILANPHSHPLGYSKVLWGGCQSYVVVVKHPVCEHWVILEGIFHLMAEAILGHFAVKAKILQWDDFQRVAHPKGGKTVFKKQYRVELGEHWWPRSFDQYRYNLHVARRAGVIPDEKHPHIVDLEKAKQLRNLDTLGGPPEDLQSIEGEAVVELERIWVAWVGWARNEGFDWIYEDGRGHTQGGQHVLHPVTQNTDG